MRNNWHNKYRTRLRSLIMFKNLFPQFSGSHRKVLFELMALIVLWGLIVKYNHLKPVCTDRDIVAAHSQEKE